MRYLRDSFLHFLSDNLSGITVSGRRYSKDSPDLMEFNVNAVNVSFIGDHLSQQIGCSTAVIDIVQEDELTAVDWTRQIFDLLRSAGYTPKLDYTNPSAPTPVGSNLMWDINKVQFKEIVTDYYFRYSCALRIYHTPLQ